MHQNLPVVLGDAVPVLHDVPVVPRRHRVAGTPDLLAPDNILEPKGAAVVHDPLGDLLSRHGRHLYSIPLALIQVPGQEKVNLRRHHPST